MDLANQTDPAIEGRVSFKLTREPAPRIRMPEDPYHGIPRTYRSERGTSRRQDDPSTSRLREPSNKCLRHR